MARYARIDATGKLNLDKLFPDYWCRWFEDVKEELASDGQFFEGRDDRLTRGGMNQ